MKIAVLGTGYMGSAIIRGLINKYDAHDIFVQGHTVNEDLLRFQKELGFQLIQDGNFEDIDILIVATPAKTTLDILEQIHVGKQTIIVSAAQGVASDDLKKLFNDNSVSCIIPNIPVAVNSGAIAVEDGKNSSADDFDKTTTVLKALGHPFVVKEENLDIVGIIVGCGPAFVDLFLSAISDAAVQHGLDRALSYKMAALMVLGSADLAFQTELNPAELKDQVTSPGGSTIKGVISLEATGFRNSVIQAINQAHHH